MQDYKALSFFSGAQGMDIGLRNAGIDVVLGQDIDWHCHNTGVINNHKIIQSDIQELSAASMLSRAQLVPGQAFLVCGGPPCQPFSTAGKRMGINDPRGSLFRDFIRMLQDIQPRFFVMENVKGLLSAKLKDENGRDTDTKVFEIIQEEFQRLGYKIIYGVLDAVNYGAPQFRERLIIIGSRDNENIFLPIPTHFPTHQDPNHRWAVLNDVIKDLEFNTGPCAVFAPNRIKILKLVPEGGNWKDLPGDIAREAMGNAYFSGGGKTGFFRRLAFNQPSPTLTTNPVQKATMLCHPTQDRPLSVAEYARIQQFPDDWKFWGHELDQYRQIGNAVPIKLAEAIGKAILATANGDAEVYTKRLRGTSVHTKIQEALSAN